MGVNQKLVQHLSSVENAHRKNTIAVDLSNIYGWDNMPNRLDMFKFVHKKLNIRGDELVEIQDSPFLPHVFVKVRSEEVMLRVETKIKAGVRMDSRDITLFGWRCDIPLTTVKLNGVNYDTTQERVVEVMGKYGKVESCERGKVDYFKNCFVSDGTWKLRIRADQGKGLPSTLYFTDEAGNTDIWSVIFDGKVAACYKCGGENHRGDRCRASKPKPADNGMTAPVGVGTYCDIVKAGVAIEWKGMMNQEESTEQLSLKPKPVEAAKKVVKQKQGNKRQQPQQQQQQEVVKKKLSELSEYADIRRMSPCMKGRMNLDDWPGLPLANKYAGLEVDEIEWIEVEGSEKSGPPKRPRTSSKGDKVRGVKSKMDKSAEDDEFFMYGESIVNEVVGPVEGAGQGTEPVLDDKSGGNSDGGSELSQESQRLLLEKKSGGNSEGGSQLSQLSQESDNLLMTQNGQNLEDMEEATQFSHPLGSQVVGIGGQLGPGGKYSSEDESESEDDDQDNGSAIFQKTLVSRANF